MAQWKKVIVSGSSISQLTNDANYLINAQSGAALTGSFTGSFTGDGSNLTGLTADSVAFGNITSKPTLVSGSVQVTISDTTGYGTFSSSLATDIATNVANITSNDGEITVLNTSASLLQTQIDDLDGTYTTDAELNTSSSALTAAYIAADTALSTSLATDIATNTSAIANLDSTYATDAQLDAVSSSLAADISSISTDFADIENKPTLVSASAQVDITGTAGYGTFSSSLATDIASNLSAIQSNDGDITQLQADSGSFSTRVTAVEGQLTDLGDTYTTDAELNASSSALIAGYTAADTALSTSLATDIASNLSAIQSNDGDITTLNTSASLLQTQIDGLDSTYATDAELNASSSALTAAYVAADTALSTSLAVDIAQNTADIGTNASDITALESFQTDVETSLTFDSTNTTVAGNLTVNGTASFAVINSVTGSAKIIGDAYLILNADSPAERYAGIKVIDSGSTDTGSLEYDSISNHWFYQSTDEGYASSFLAGPRGTRGALPEIPKHTILVGDGGTHMTGSSIIDSGSTVRISKGLNVTGSIELSGTVDGIDLQAHSSSLSTRITAVEDDITALGDTYTTDVELNASSSALQANIDSVETGARSELNASSSALITAYTAADDNLSSSLAADIATNTSAIANLDSTYATDAELDAVSSSFATTIDGLTSDYTELTNIPNGIVSSSNQIESDISGSFTEVSASFASTIDGLTSDYTELTNIPGGIISSSAQTVAALSNQETDFGTGAVTASFFVGDGSKLTNIEVAQSATVISDFTSQTSVTVTHNFDSLNVLATVYDDNDFHILPASTQTVNSNQITVTFDTATSGRVIVGKGGHVVSGSIPFTNIIAKPTLVSGSGQVNIVSTEGYGTFSSSLATDIATNTAAIANLDNTYATDAELDAVSSSFATTIDGLTSDYTELTNIPNGIVSSSNQIASDISGSFTEASASLAADIANISTDFADITNKPTLISGSTYSSPSQGTLRATINGVNSDIDLGLQSGDSPTFTNLTVSGDLTVTGNTFEAQVTNLNVEDRFVLLNSGSNSGDSGIIFGGSDGTANQGSGLFFDNPAGVFGFSQGIGATDTSATHTSKIGNIETSAGAPSSAPTFQGTGTIHINSSNGDIYIYTD